MAINGRSTAEHVLSTAEKYFLRVVYGLYMVTSNEQRAQQILALRLDLM